MFDVRPHTRFRQSPVADLPTRRKAPSSSVLAPEEETIIVAARTHTVLPLDDCLYALQATIPAGPARCFTIFMASTHCCPVEELR